MMSMKAWDRSGVSVVLVVGLLLACYASLGVEAWFVVPSKNNWRATDTTWSAARPTAATTTVRTGSGGTVRPQLTMKRAPKPKVPQVVMEQDGELPSNLSRKVQAKRPALGHVVPKSSKGNNGDELEWTDNDSSLKENKQ
eukprot:scaffold3139_cov44-Attheya_sp.AAC.1